MTASAGPLPLNPEGCWEEVLRPGAAPPRARRPALFLDRDGVLIEDVGYLADPARLRLLPGAADLVAAANRRGIPVVVVTNQSAIGRGLLDWHGFARIQERLAGELARSGAVLDMVLACPFHPEAAPPFRHADHPWRKPRPGMLLRAGDRLALDLAASWVVGDGARDLAAGRAAGLAGGILVTAAAGGRHGREAAALASPDFEVRLAASPAGCRGLLPWLS